MASVDNLSDDEIRSYLVKLNLPIVPITDSTRKLLLRKIQAALDNKSTPNSPAAKRSAKKNSRANVSTTNNYDTVAVSLDMLPPATLPVVTRRKSKGNSVDSPHPFSPSKNSTALSNSTFNDSVDDVSSSIFSSTRRRGRAQTPASYQNGFETGSDSDAPEKPSRSNVSSRKKSSPVSTSFKSPIFPSIFSNLPTSIRTNDLSPPKSRPSSPAVRSSHDTFDYARKPLSGYNTRYSSGGGSGNNSNAGAGASPFIKESGDEEEYSPRLPKRFFPPPVMNNNHVGPVKYTKKSNFANFATSKILLGSCVLFFLCIAFIYFSIHSNSAYMFNNTDTKYPICGSGHIEPGVTCVMDEDIAVAIEFLPQIYDELRDRSVSKRCGYPNTEDQLNDQETHKLLSEKNPMTTDWELRTHVPNIKVLINSNPQWSLRATKDSIGLSKVDLPITCSISSFFAKLVYYGVQCIFLVIGSFVAYKGYMFYIDRKQKTHREILKIVDDILQLIRAQAEKYPDEPYLPIRHIKDQLIPLSERANLNKVWLGVIKFLENEARVRQEIQMVQGEDQDVWRWLPPQPLVPRKNKTWQGAAFETDEGSVNALPVSPTACLKIRNMFDPKEEDHNDTKWVTNVEDAILEKCEGINILHIGVDRTSSEGIVFMKCSSCNDAGRAYKSLHGSWFNSKLVTVKYLRYERYHERFPEAKAVVVPLKPSNGKKLSLQN